MSTNKAQPALSVIIPAKNEEHGLRKILPELRRQLPDAELIVIDDGSTDGTRSVSEELGATVIQHPYSKGNGAAIKTGVRHASGKTIICLDADGQHRPDELPDLLEHFHNHNYDMLVGSRSFGSQANVFRGLANRFYNWLATTMVGHPVRDLTSGLRVIDAKKFRQFLYLLPNGFSYPTTITMAFFRSGYSVGYYDFNAEQRIGKSHINIARDGIRFLLIIFKIGTLYSPLKLFTPISALLFFTAFGYYLYTFFTFGRFTNMSAVLMTTSILTFLMGLVSEQVTSLIYQNTSKSD